jgi:hypothetical protein
VCLISSTIDLNAVGFEEGEGFEGFEEDSQWHFVDQGKTPLDAYLDHIVLFFYLFTTFYKLHVCHYLFLLVVISGCTMYNSSSMLH